MDLQGDILEPKVHRAVVVPAHMEDAAPVRAGLMLKTKVLYGIGEISNSVKAFTFGLFLLFFYTSVLGLPGTLVGLATALGLVWDALIDPFIGHLSDGARFRFGRRHTFMLAGAVCMGVTFFAIFSPPTGLSAGSFFVWLIVTSFLLRTANSIFMVPYHALGAELSQDYYERTSVTGFRAAFALFGTLVAAGLSFVAFFPNRTPGVDPKFNPSGYLWMGLVFGLAITVTGLIATFGTLSHPSRPQVAHAAADGDKLGFFANLKLSLSTAPFLFLTISAGIFFLASVINATLAIYYLTYYARITQSSSLSLFQLSFYVGALAGVPCWLRVARRIDKHRLYFGAAVVVALLMIGAYALVGEGRLFGIGNIVPLLVGNAIAGFFASALWVLPASMIADVADQDELKTGRRREGAFFGIHSFFNQEAASLALLTAGVLVDRFAGLVPGQMEQSPQTIHRLALLFSLLPAALVLIAALLILGYRLTRGRVEAIQRELEERHTHGTHGH